MSAHIGRITPRQGCLISPTRPTSPPKSDLRDVTDFFFQSLEFHFVHGMMDPQLNRADFRFTQCVFLIHMWGPFSVLSEMSNQYLKGRKWKFGQKLKEYAALITRTVGNIKLGWIKHPPTWRMHNISHVEFISSDNQASKANQLA